MVKRKHDEICDDSNNTDDIDGISLANEDDAEEVLSRIISSVASSSRSESRFNNLPGHQELLLNKLNNGVLICVLCLKQITNDKPGWNCPNCLHILHLDCTHSSYLHSCSLSNIWSCPTCKEQIMGRPINKCFCGALLHPLPNSMVTSYSCGQVCERRKVNANMKYECNHKCALLCHPGPCPPCTLQVTRNCCCEKTKIDVQCSQSTPILCTNICGKPINCKIHVCEKSCHAENCELCKICPQMNESDDETEDLGPKDFSQDEEKTSSNQIETMKNYSRPSHIVTIKTLRRRINNLFIADPIDSSSSSDDELFNSDDQELDGQEFDSDEFYDQDFDEFEEFDDEDFDEFEESDESHSITPMTNWDDSDELRSVSETHQEDANDQQRNGLLNSDNVFEEDPVNLQNRSLFELIIEESMQAFRRLIYNYTDNSIQRIVYRRNQDNRPTIDFYFPNFTLPYNYSGASIDERYSSFIIYFGSYLQTGDNVRFTRIRISILNISGNEISANTWININEHLALESEEHQNSLQ